MLIKGLVPLPPYEKFAEDAIVTFPEGAPFYREPDHERLGLLISAGPTADRESLELVVELDEGKEIPNGWSNDD